VCSFRKKNQTKVTYRLQLRVRDAALPPLYFRLQSSPLPRINKPHPLVPSLAASTMARSRGGTGNKNLNFKLGHYTVQCTLIEIHTFKFKMPTVIGHI
jgi:hypothetical protein